MFKQDVSLTKEEKSMFIACVDDVQEILEDKIKDLDKETIFVLYPNSKAKENTLYGHELDSVDISDVRSEDVVQTAEKLNATGIVIAHFQPVGTPTIKEEYFNFSKSVFGSMPRKDLGFTSYVFGRELCSNGHKCQDLAL